MEQIVVNNPVYTEAIAGSVGVSYERRAMSVSRVKDGVLLGGVVYYDHTGESLCVHVAGWDDHWVNRDILFCMFDYPFNQMGVKRVFAQIPADNQRSLDFNEKLGFKTACVIAGVYPNNVACIVRCIERPEAERFLKIRPLHIARPQFH